MTRSIILADAIKRAGSTDSDKLVDRAGKDRLCRHHRHASQFKGKDDRPIRTRSRSARAYITGLMLQWQNGKQVNLWPADVANGKLKFPKFIKVGAARLIRQSIGPRRQFSPPAPASGEFS